MAPRGSKRASSSGAGRSTRRRAAANAAFEQCDTIAHALAKANREVLPKEAAEMLASMLRPCLAVEKDRRHDVQASIVELIGRALREQASALEQDLEQRRAAVAGVDTDRTERQTGLDRARGEIAGLEAAVAAQKEELATASAHNATKEGELKVAQKALKVAEAAHKAVADKKEEVKVAAEVLEVLKGSSVGRTAEARASFKKLSTVCSSYEVESSLAGTVLKCLKKEVPARQAFDVSAIEELCKTLQKLIAVIEDELKVKEEPRSQALEAARVAQDAAAEANKAREACQTASAEARSAEKAGHHAVKLAEKRLAAWLHDTKVTMDGFDGQLMALAELREGPLAAYEALRELQPEPEPAEEAAEPAEPAAATEEPEEPVVAANAEEATGAA